MKIFYTTITILFASLTLFFIGSVAQSHKASKPATTYQTISPRPVAAKSSSTSTTSTKITSAPARKPIYSPETKSNSYNSRVSYTYNYSYDDGYEDLMDNDEVDYDRYICSFIIRITIQQTSNTNKQTIKKHSTEVLYSCLRILRTNLLSVGC